MPANKYGIRTFLTGRPLAHSPRLYNSLNIKNLHQFRVWVKIRLRVKVWGRNRVRVKIWVMNRVSKIFHV